MQYEVKESGYRVIVTSAKFDVVITPQAPLQINMSESAKIEVPQAINYIKSGEAEIKVATDIGVSRISSTVTDGLNQYNANATAKTTAYNDNAADKLGAYNLNAQNLTTAFDTNASDKTTAFNNNATSKTGDFNTNATNKTNAFNQNATDKTTAFNDNAAIKKASVDESATEAKQWAIGNPSEPTGNSAKYWANQAASSLSGLNSRVTTIESEIPAQASSSNQLADKNFVNSSIATNTATFIGTFNSVAELEAYTGAKDDNDYAFAISTDAAGNTLYNRYKWNGSAWLFEYALNNSSFTANQWAAINSGATTANIGQIAAKANDNAVVHKTGNETITGIKTFSGDGRIIYLQNLTVTYDTAPNSDKYTDLSFRDKNNVEMGVLESVRRSDNSTGVRLVAKGADGNFSTSLGVYRKANGSVYTSAPTPSAGDNSDQIATTRWVNSTGNNVVHKTGDETITGTKTYTGDGWITKIQNTDVTYNIAPSSDKGTSIIFADKNGTQMGVVECFRSTDNSTMTRLNSYSPNGSWGSQSLQLRVFSDGYTVAYAPTPDVNAYGDEIATAAYVKNVLSSLYPVGSIYIGTQSTCPLATLISGSTWKLVSAGRVLQGSDSGHNAGTTIEAGLPNITGTFNTGDRRTHIIGTSGAIYRNTVEDQQWGGQNGQYGNNQGVGFDASRSNSIYGNSNTVQPPAYVVNIWRRTA